MHRPNTARVAPAAVDSESTEHRRERRAIWRAQPACDGASTASAVESTAVNGTENGRIARKHGDVNGSTAESPESENEPTPPPPVLLPHHQTLLVESGVSTPIYIDRGYLSVTKPKELEGKFSSAQQRLVPALEIPLYDVYGELAYYQLRPDNPRVSEGRIRKYEIPWRAPNVLDVHPTNTALLGDPSIPLWLTEGIRKGDSLASIGLLAVTLIGVNSWRGKNDADGITVLPDWEKVALKGREVNICFDSDAQQNPNVHTATARLARWLESRGAHVKYVYLPAGEHGAKQGVDDYLGAGHTREELLGLIETSWRPLPSQPATDPKPWGTGPPPEVDGAKLLADAGRFFRRFVILPSDDDYLTLALFTLHSWAFAAAYATPYLVVESPEKQCGKTRLLEVLKLVCRDAILANSITAAAVGQVIERRKPTLLVDEADALFKSDSDRSEELRGVLNGGNRPGSPTLRGTQDGEGREFDIYSPKVIAGIATGKLPDTVRDRSIPITINRKKRAEKVERLKHRRVEPEAKELRERAQAWAETHLEALEAFDLPDAIEALSDRLEEAWEPLLAIANELGEEHLERATRAAVTLATGHAPVSSTANRILGHVREVFGDAERMFSVDIIAAFLEKERDWTYGDWNDGKGINPSNLAWYLGRYDISPGTVRIDGEDAKGYKREQLEGAWERYLPEPKDVRRSDEGG